MLACALGVPEFDDKLSLSEALVVAASLHDIGYACAPGEAAGGVTTRRAFDQGIGFTQVRGPGTLRLERQITACSSVHLLPAMPRRPRRRPRPLIPRLRIGAGPRAVRVQSSLRSGAGVKPKGPVVLRSDSDLRAWGTGLAGPAFPHSCRIVRAGAPGQGPGLGLTRCRQLRAAPHMEYLYRSESRDPALYSSSISLLASR